MYRVCNEQLVCFFAVSNINKYGLREEMAVIMRYFWSCRKRWRPCQIGILDTHTISCSRDE
jgi:hypothetical protein